MNLKSEHLLEGGAPAPHTVDRLRARFGIGRVCVVAVRGMISAATVAAPEERGLDYILEACERRTKVVREVVLRDERPFVPLLLELARGETQLFVKEVKVDGARYRNSRPRRRKAPRVRPRRHFAMTLPRLRHATGRPGQSEDRRDLDLRHGRTGT